MRVLRSVLGTTTKREWQDASDRSQHSHGNRPPFHRPPRWPLSRPCALAQKPALFAYAVHPLLRATGLPDRFDGAGVGTELSARIWWLGVIPSWRHRLRVTAIEATELRTTERGGPLRRWDHTLTFEPRGPRACRYTDTIELDAGLATPIAWCRAQLLFRWRQRRWRQLARVLA